MTEIALSRSSPGDCDAFELPDYEIRRITAYARDLGLLVIAVFHSHPSGSIELSEGDRASIGHSEWPWVLVTRSAATQNLVLTAYARSNGKPLSLQVIGSAEG